MWIHIFAITFILLLVLYKSTKKPNRFPPGPPRLPIIGSLPYINGKLKTSDNPSLVHGIMQGKYFVQQIKQITIQEISFV